MPPFHDKAVSGWGTQVLCLIELLAGLPAHAVFAGVDGGAGLAVGFVAALGFALIPILLAFGDGQLALDAAITEVEAGGDERMTLDLRLGE